MPFANGVFNRLRRWVGETNISPVEFDQDGDDVALALSTAILRDGTGQPTADTPWNNHKITSLAAAVNAGDALSYGGTPAAAITGALGFTPVQQGAGPGQAGNKLSFGWDNSWIRASVDGADLGQLWGVGNLKAAQIANILGYAPGRTLGAFQASASGLSDIANTGRQYALSSSFVAPGASAFFIASTSFQDQTSGTSGQPAFLGCDLFDVAAGGVVATATECQVSVTFGSGLVPAISVLAIGGLTPGRTYQARLYVYKNTTTATILTTNLSINGICA